MSASAQPSVEQGRVNLLAVCSVAVGLLALASMVGLGSGVPAAFALGAGHVALRQLQQRPGQGRGTALTGLFLGYGVSTWALALSLGDLFMVAYPA